MHALGVRSAKRGRVFWATSIASFGERLSDIGSCWIVFIHEVRGLSGGLSREAVKILASIASGILVIWPNMPGLDNSRKLWLPFICLTSSFRTWCYRASPSESAWFTIESGVCQECVLTPDFRHGLDWLLESIVNTGMNGVSFQPHSFSYLDFADDAAVLAELLELFVPAFETIELEAAYLELEVN